MSRVEQYTKFLSDKKLHMATLQHLVTCGVISKGMGKNGKVGSMSLALQLVYERNGED